MLLLICSVMIHLFVCLFVCLNLTWFQVSNSCHINFRSTFHVMPISAVYFMSCQFQDWCTFNFPVMFIWVCFSCHVNLLCINYFIMSISVVHFMSCQFQVSISCHVHFRSVNFRCIIFHDVSCSCTFHVMSFSGVHFMSCSFQECISCMSISGVYFMCTFHVYISCHVMFISGEYFTFHSFIHSFTKCTSEIDMTWNGQLKLTWNVYLNLTWNEIHTLYWLDMKCTPEMDSMKYYTPNIDIWHEIDTWNGHEIYTWNWHDIKCSLEMDMMKYYTPEIDMTWNEQVKLT